jgi:hypothetical protein
MQDAKVICLPPQSGPDAKQDVLASKRLLLGRFEVLETKNGGNATVYKALDTQTNKIVALKEVTHTQCENAGTSKLLTLIQREFRAGMNLNHPNLTAYHEAFEDTENGGFLLVRDWAEGHSLQEMADGGRRFTDAQINTIIGKVLDAVAYMHSLNPPIIHRDIKPANVVVKMGGEDILEVKLIDLGAVTEEPDRKHSCTQITMHVGTPGYLAPEALSNPCIQSDIFSVGATLLFLKARKDADGVYNAAEGIHAVPPEISGKHREVIQKALEVPTAKRFQSAEEMKAALEGTESIVPVAEKQEVVPAGDQEVAQYRQLLSKMSLDELYFFAGSSPDKKMREAAIIRIIIRISRHDYPQPELALKILEKLTFYGKLAKLGSCIRGERIFDELQELDVKVSRTARIAAGAQLVEIYKNSGDWRPLRAMAASRHNPDLLCVALAWVRRHHDYYPPAYTAPRVVKKLAAKALEEAVWNGVVKSLGLGGMADANDALMEYLAFMRDSDGKKHSELCFKYVTWLARNGRSNDLLGSNIAKFVPELARQEARRMALEAGQNS